MSMRYRKHNSHEYWVHAPTAAGCSWWRARRASACPARCTSQPACEALSLPATQTNRSPPNEITEICLRSTHPPSLLVQSAANPYLFSVAAAPPRRRCSSSPASSSASTRSPTTGSGERSGRAITLFTLPLLPTWVNAAVCCDTAPKTAGSDDCKGTAAFTEQMHSRSLLPQLVPVLLCPPSTVAFLCLLLSHRGRYSYIDPSQLHAFAGPFTIPVPPSPHITGAGTHTSMCCATRGARS